MIENITISIDAIHIKCTGSVSVDIEIREIDLVILGFQLIKEKDRIEVSIPENFDRKTCTDFPTVKISDKMLVKIIDYLNDRLGDCDWFLKCCESDWKEFSD